jgi:hypothetical protein
MKAEEIAEKYVHGHHDALTDNQEKIDMANDINDLVESETRELQKSHAELLEALEELVKCMDERDSHLLPNCIKAEKAINNATK